MNNLFLDHDDIARAVDSIANPLEHLVGEGKKFKTSDDLAKGKLHADLMIDKLNVERNEIKAQKEALQAELDRLRDTSKSTLDALSREVKQDSHINEDNSRTKMITEEDIDKRVEAKLAQAQEQRTRQANVDTVRTELQKTFGDAWQTKLEEAAAEFGGKDTLAMLAETNPKALLKLVVPTGTTEQPKQATLFDAPVSSARPVFNKDGTIKGEKYYAKLRREQPNTYWSGESFRERVEQMQKLGANYYNH